MSILKMSRRVMSALLFGQAAVMVSRSAPVPRPSENDGGRAAGLDAREVDPQAKIYPRTDSEIRAEIVPRALSFPPGNVRRYGAVGDLATNDTESIAQALRVVESWGGVSVYFPPGSYLVDSLIFAHNGTYYFDNANLFANSTAPEQFLVKFTAAYSNVYNMALNCRWKSNYACALWWTSTGASSPSQSNNFWALSVQNTLLGILYGTPTGGLNVPQSENYVYGFHSRGTAIVLHSNQPNGFIAFVGGQLTSSKNEWDLHSPKTYDFAAANVITNTQGVVRCVGCDLEKPESAAGCGFIQTGSNSVTELCDCDYEIACQNVRLSAGRFLMRGGGGYWSNRSASCIALAGSTGGQLHISGFTLNKDPSCAGADTAFIDLGGTSNWDITLANLRLENQRNLIFFNGSATANVWVGNRVYFNNVESVSAGGGAPSPLFPRISSDANNLLDLRGTDTVGNDAATWYRHDISGSAEVSLSDDVPVESVFANSFQCAIRGQTSVTSVDVSDLKSAKATGIMCKPGDQFMVSGWYRAMSPGTAQILALFAPAIAGAPTRVVIADNAQFRMTEWVHITGLFTAPANCAYMGVGIGGSAAMVRMVGLKVSRLA